MSQSVITTSLTFQQPIKENAGEDIKHEKTNIFKKVLKDCCYIENNS